MNAGMAFDWDKLPESEPIPGFHGRVVHSDTMTFVLWRIKAGAVLPEHNHVHEQVAMVLDGTFEVTVSGQTRRMNAGMIGTIPAWPSPSVASSTPSSRCARTIATGSRPTSSAEPPARTECRFANASSKPMS